MNARRVDVQDTYLDGDITQDLELDLIVEGRVTNEIGGVGLNETGALDNDGYDYLPDHVGLMEEAREEHANSDLVGVLGEEEHVDVKGERGRSHVEVRV
ncbi:hypothetical protein ACLB2K_052985 [Fragaria x ananassa]